MKPFNFLMILSALFFFFLFFMRLHLKEGLSAKIQALLFGLAALVFIATGSLWFYLAPYRAIYPYIFPGIRDRHAKSYNYEYYDRSEQRRYRNLYLPHRLENNPLYERVEKKIPIEYLGTMENGETYFKDQDGYFYAYSYIHYDDAKEANITVYQYLLKDPRFENIGFAKDTKNYFIDIHIPEKEKRIIDTIPGEGDILQKHYHQLIFP
ncbi:MAG: hypothetical protein Q4P28_04205 [Tissierellia bacterium]|nr:hypothetical protein [Tissierellia bacterium]